MVGMTCLASTFLVGVVVENHFPDWIPTRPLFFFLYLISNSRRRAWTEDFLMLQLEVTAFLQFYITNPHRKPKSKCASRLSTERRVQRASPAR